MENKLTVDRALLDAAYQNATDEQREVLVKVFGRDAFATSWQEDLKRACKDLGVNSGDSLPWVNWVFDDKETEVPNAYAALRILAKWVRGDWEPDWSDAAQAKYAPCFDMRANSKPIGCIDNYVITTVGSRLCFPTKQMAADFATKYLDLYKIILTN